MPELISPPWILHDHGYCKIMGLENTRDVVFCTVLFRVCVFCFLLPPRQTNSIVKIARLLPKLRRNIRVLSTQEPPEFGQKFSIEFKGFWFTQQRKKKIQNSWNLIFNQDLRQITQPSILKLILLYYFILLGYLIPLGISKQN